MENVCPGAYIQKEWEYELLFEGHTEMFTLYNALRNWGWDYLPNKIREDKTIANLPLCLFAEVLCGQQPLQ